MLTVKILKSTESRHTHPLSHNPDKYIYALCWRISFLNILGIKKKIFFASPLKGAFIREK